jgi:hypothetical protein
VVNRIAWIFGLAAVLVASLGSAALAQYPPTTGPPGQAPPPAGGVAETGINLGLGLVVLVVLVVVGTALLFVRHRGAREV